jgi:hypothetical protein
MHARLGALLTLRAAYTRQCRRHRGCAVRGLGQLVAPSLRIGSRVQRERAMKRECEGCGHVLPGETDWQILGWKYYLLVAGYWAWAAAMYTLYGGTRTVRMKWEIFVNDKYYGTREFVWPRLMVGNEPMNDNNEVMPRGPPSSPRMTETY